MTAKRYFVYKCISEKMTLAKLDCPTTLSTFISNLLYGSCGNKIWYDCSKCFNVDLNLKVP